MLEIITATRLEEEEFWRSSALARSIARFTPDPEIRIIAAFQNRRGLPDIYNGAIDCSDQDADLVFVHDDVWIEDFFLGWRVQEGLKAFDVIGVAGNRRRAPRQSSWAHPREWEHDTMQNLSGRVAHNVGNPLGDVTLYGPVPAECELVDGVFLAARRSVLKARDVRFDPVFDFHFYDLDFCRTARSRGLRIGTWPICLTHETKEDVDRSYGGEAWREKRDRYFSKWGE